ncbi:DUF6461 domain-containing protein [Nonomuraea angiospora]|uniref:DUF6461 domain-containing protein n=1 Tax=Nonomuraea angiospora TaxID=46172 RepID=UPI0033D720C6
MTLITKQDVAWLTDEWEVGEVWCLVFAEGLGEHEALTRAGAAYSSIRPMTYAELMDGNLFSDTLLARRVGGWTVLLEVNGAEVADALEQVSANTRAIAVSCNDHASDLFAFAQNGELVTCFDPIDPTSRWGTDPDRLTDLMGSAGLFPDYGRAGDDSDDGEPRGVAEALVLTAEITGVTLTPDILDEPMVAGTRQRA